MKAIVQTAYGSPEVLQYPLSETAEAMRYLGTAHARGKVIITVGK
jgi:hypothetical protein